MRPRPRFYFSFRSPYSWIAARVLHERCDPHAHGLEYIPYWEPDGQTSAALAELGATVLYAPMSRQKHLYILQDVRRLARRLGYEHAWPVDSAPWWELPHLAYLEAQRRGRGLDFLWAVYDARWERGLDICRRETIRALAEQVGLEPTPLETAPDNPERRAEGVEALRRAHRDGVFGMPFFVDGRDRFWGVDRVELFIEALNAPAPGQVRPA
jgi:2-hydroxychromene-2-carboxylate isomerase